LHSTYNIVLYLYIFVRIVHTITVDNPIYIISEQFKDIATTNLFDVYVRKTRSVCEECRRVQDHLPSDHTYPRAATSICYSERYEIATFQGIGSKGFHSNNDVVWLNFISKKFMERLPVTKNRCDVYTV
jgi:hypothetical protein